MKTRNSFLDYTTTCIRFAYYHFFFSFPYIKFFFYFCISYYSRHTPSRERYTYLLPHCSYRVRVFVVVWTCWFIIVDIILIRCKLLGCIMYVAICSLLSFVVRLVFLLAGRGEETKVVEICAGTDFRLQGNIGYWFYRIIAFSFPFLIYYFNDDCSIIPISILFFHPFACNNFFFWETLYPDLDKNNSEKRFKKSFDNFKI